MKSARYHGNDGELSTHLQGLHEGEKNEVTMAIITPINRTVKLDHSTMDYSAIPYNELPDPSVAFDEWPNPPWNTTRYDWYADYPVCSDEWFAQHSARSALKIGLQYSVRDRAKEQKDSLDKHLVTHGDKPPALKNHKGAPMIQESEKALKITVGVVTDTHLCYFDHGKPIKKPLESMPTNIGDIMQLCLDHGLRAIWVYPETQLSGMATSDFIEAARPTWEIGERSAQYTDGPATQKKYCKFVGGRKPDSRRVYVGYAEHNEDWGLEEVSNPLPLIAALTYIEDALGVPVLYSAGKVGTMLMEDVNKKKRIEWVRHIDIRKIPALKNDYVRDASWKRPLTAEEMQRSNVVAYDKTMQYPGSGTSVLLGSGEPEYTDCPRFDMKKSPPGIWYCKISGKPSPYPFDGKQLPHPTDGILEGWFYTYTVKLLHELGYTVEILEAWVWNESHTILRSWSESVRDAYSSLCDDWEPNVTRYKNAEARAIAAKAIKHLGRKSIGWIDLNDAFFPGREEELAWYIRPDWRRLLVDNASYQMFWRIRTYLEKGYWPVGIHVDCLYYIVDTPDHGIALPHMMERKNPKTKQYEPNQHKLGGYKPHYKTPITVAEAAPLFNDESLDMGEVNIRLHQIDRGHRTGRE